MKFWNDLFLSADNVHSDPSSDDKQRTGDLSMQRLAPLLSRVHCVPTSPATATIYMKIDVLIPPFFALLIRSLLWFSHRFVRSRLNVMILFFMNSRASVTAMPASTPNRYCPVFVERSICSERQMVRNGNGTTTKIKPPPLGTRNINDLTSKSNQPVAT